MKLSHFIIAAIVVIAFSICYTYVVASSDLPDFLKYLLLR